jgi:hypothetical protein
MSDIIEPLGEDFLIEQFKQTDKINRHKNFKYKIYAFLAFIDYCNKNNLHIEKNYSFSGIISMKNGIANRKLFGLAYEMYNFFFTRYADSGKVKKFADELATEKTYD